VQIDDLQVELRSLIEAKDFAALKARLEPMEAHDLAWLLIELDDQELAVCFRLLPQDKAAEILGEFEPDQQAKLLATLSTENVAAILNEMPPDDRTELLEEMPGEIAQQLLASLRGEERRIARSLLAYPEDSVGRLMTPEYVAVRPDWTAARALEHLRRHGAEMETLNVVLVTDERSRLLGRIRLTDLVLAEPERTARELMQEQAGVLHAADDREAAVDIFMKYDAVALPVVDARGTLVGMVTVDDVLDVAAEETTEDFQRMVGVLPLEYRYFGTGFLAMFRKRLPWLAMLLGAQLLTTVALLGFHSVPLFAALVVFMPLINSPAGNAGSQAAGLMIRGMAVQEIDLDDWHRVLAREIARGVVLGAVLGVLGFGGALLFARAVETGTRSPGHIALSVGLALVLAVAMANLVGSMLPFAFRRLGLDPAVTSGPFIASLMDVSGIMIYFTIASAVFAGVT
jgi:magnesium transporter